MELNQQTVDTLAALVAGQGQIRTVENADPFIVVPGGYSVHVIPGTKLNPVRKVAQRKFTEIDSFIGYVQEQKLPETRIYVTSQTEVVAVIDHHQPSEESESKAGYGEHVAKLTLTHTPEWKTWTAKNAQKFGQREFSVFIEDNLDDISRPSGGDMLDLVRTFRATQNAEFNGVIGEKQGNSQLGFTQTTKTQAGVKGELEIPEDFDLLVAPYEGSTAHTIKCRLRFEINNGRLQLWYEIVKMERFLKACLTSIQQHIETDLGHKLWSGTP